MGARVEYLGTIKRMNNGQHAEVIEYINSRDMTIKFEDGTILRHVKKVHFDAGKVRNPNSMSSKIGETRRMNNGLLATIVGYNNCNDITVQFENGAIVEHRRYAHFERGAIAETSLDYSNRKNSHVGQTIKMKCGMKATCIDYMNMNNITVQFEDGTIVSNKTVVAFENGNILNPNIGRKYTNNSKDYIGTRKRMNCGEYCTIIEYNYCDDITVQFEDGEIIRHRTLTQFNNGAIDSSKSKMNTRSLPQMLVYLYLKYYFASTMMNYRPNWMKNERTGINFELDIYIPELKLAIEYDGYNGIHQEKTQNEIDKYNKIYGAEQIDYIIVIYEKGCIKHNRSVKLKEYQLNYTSKGYDYSNLIDELMIIIKDILCNLGIEESEVKDKVSIGRLMNNSGHNYKISDLRSAVYNKIMRLINSK